MSKGAGFSIDLGGASPLEIDGWADLDRLGDDEGQRARTLTQQVEHASLYRQVFSSNAGQYVLKDLIECFYKQRIVDPMDQPGSLVPGIRQGQRDVVERIFHMIEFANTGGGKLTGPGARTEE